MATGDTVADEYKMYQNDLKMQVLLELLLPLLCIVVDICAQLRLMDIAACMLHAAVYGRREDAVVDGHSARDVHRKQGWLLVN